MVKTEKEKLTLEPPRGKAEGEKQQTREGPSGCQCVRSEHETLKEEPKLLRPKSGGREQGPDGHCGRHNSFSKQRYTLDRREVNLNATALQPSF